MIFLSAVTCIPVFAATNSFSFTMKNRYISGDSNNQHHILRAGNVYIKGTITSTKQNNNYGGTSPNPISIALYRSKTGIDKYCGEVALGKSKNIKITERKLGKADITSGKYYLVIYKAENDYWTSTGSGKVYNK